MTTTLMPPDPASSTERAARTLTISANLLPPEIVEYRHTRRSRRIALSALTAFAVLLGGWYGAASYQTSLARGDLSDAQSDVERLVRQQKPFAELIRTQSESRTAGAQLSSLFAGDLRWWRLLGSLQEAAPNGVRLASVSAGLTPSGKSSGGGDSGRPRLPNTSTEKVIGTLTITGAAPDKAAVAAYLDALGKVPGLANPILDGANERDGGLDFSVRVDITNSALGGRYPGTNNNESKGR